MSGQVSLAVSTDNGDVVFVQVDLATNTIEDVKALLELKTRVPLASQVILKDNKELSNATTLTAAGVSANDMLLLRSRGAPNNAGPAPGVNAPAAPAAPAAPGAPVDPEQVRQYIRSNAQLQAQLQATNPPMYAAAMGDNPAEFARLFALQQQQQAVMQNPFDPRAQAAIEEAIRRENVNRNMQEAMENTPEVFGRVVMLYIDTEVNEVPVKAFVDTGAQSTIMSENCARRCGIMRLIDHRFAGIAKGVGTRKILGRVHNADLVIGGHLFRTSFTILEGDAGLEFILGLDMLKRYQAIIDLKENALVIGPYKAPFLPEHEIPAHLRMDGEEPPPTPPPPSGASPSRSTSKQPAAPPAPSSLSPAPGGPGTSAPPAGAAAAPVDPAKVQALVELGIPRQQAEEALRLTGGNVDAASAMFM